jgi:scyllo-inositol 2-dehydrogenase (NADP+)
VAKRGKEIIRVGIAGQGRSGHDIHAEWLGKAKDRYRVVSVADQIAGRRADAERELGARAYTDYS